MTLLELAVIGGNEGRRGRGHQELTGLGGTAFSFQGALKKHQLGEKIIKWSVVMEEAEIHKRE